MGYEMVRMIKEYSYESSILDDFNYYERRQEEFIDYKSHQYSNNIPSQNPQNSQSFSPIVNPQGIGNQVNPQLHQKINIIQNPNTQSNNFTNKREFKNNPNVINSSSNSGMSEMTTSSMPSSMNNTITSGMGNVNMPISNQNPQNFNLGQFYNMRNFNPGKGNVESQDNDFLRDQDN